MKCISCKKKEGQYQHHDGGYVCDDCVGRYLTCPDCGTLYDNDDFENGDAGNGFCRKICAHKH